MNSAKNKISFVKWSTDVTFGFETILNYIILDFLLLYGFLKDILTDTNQRQCCQLSWVNKNESHR